MKQQTLGYIVSVLMLLVLWQLASWIVHLALPLQKARILPGPLEAMLVFPAHWRDIGEHFLGTAFRLISALLISLVTAVPLGLSIGHERWARRLFSPLIYTAYPIPKVVFWPILFVLLNFGEAARISFVVLVVFFQLLVSARDAAANIPKDYVLSALAAGVSRAKIYWHVVLPAALPAIFTSLRISLGLGIFAVFIAEATFKYGNPKGLGYYIRNNLVASELVFAGIMALGILGLGLYLLIEVLERWLCRWKYV